MQSQLSSRFHDGIISLGKKRGHFACGALARKDLVLLNRFLPTTGVADLDPNLGHILDEKVASAFVEWSINSSGETFSRMPKECADPDSENDDDYNDFKGDHIIPPIPLYSC